MEPMETGGEWKEDNSDYSYGQFPNLTYQRSTEFSPDWISINMAMAQSLGS